MHKVKSGYSIGARDYLKVHMSFIRYMVLAELKILSILTSVEDSADICFS